MRVTLSVDTGERRILTSAACHRIQSLGAPVEIRDLKWVLSMSENGNPGLMLQDTYQEVTGSESPQ